MNAKKILHFSIGPIASAALGFITLPIITWFFTVEDIGRFTMMQVIFSLSVSFFSLAMHQAYVREYHEEKDKYKLLNATIIPGSIVLSVAFVALTFYPASISLLIFGLDSAWLTTFLIIGIFSSFIINFLTHILRMEERGLAFSATQVLPKLALLIFIGIILALSLDNNFLTLALINTSALLLSLIFFMWLTRNNWIPALKSAIDILLMKNMLLFSLPLVVGGIAYWGLTTMDRFFLRALSGFEELGVYAVATTLAAAVGLLSTIFSNLWHPIIYKWVKEGVEPERVQRVIENMVILVAFVWSTVGLFSWILPYFLPTQYQPVKYLIVACIGMPLFYMLSETTSVGIGITRKTSFAMLASVIAFIVNGVLNYIFIPRLGASGAAFATLVAFFIFFIIRTEYSAILWKSLPRIKIYLVTITYLITTCIIVLSRDSYKYFYFSWIILAFMTSMVFSARIKENYYYLKKLQREVKCY